MNEGDAVSLVTSNELLARFILFSKWVRNSDGTVKPDAFIPHPHIDLSVTRHKNLNQSELWQIGQGIANDRKMPDGKSATLYGRVDILAKDIRQHALNVESRPVPGNPNHANLTGWPQDKAAQKSIAQSLVAGRHLIPRT